MMMVMCEINVLQPVRGFPPLFASRTTPTMASSAGPEERCMNMSAAPQHANISQREALGRLSPSSSHFPGQDWASSWVTLVALFVGVEEIGSSLDPPPAEIHAPHFRTPSIWLQRSKMHILSFASWTRALEDAQQPGIRGRQWKAIPIDLLRCADASSLNEKMGACRVPADFLPPDIASIGSWVCEAAMRNLKFPNIFLMGKQARQDGKV